MLECVLKSVGRGRRVFRRISVFVAGTDNCGRKLFCILITESVELYGVLCYIVYIDVDSKLKFGKMKGEEKCTIRLFLWMILKHWQMQ